MLWQFLVFLVGAIFIAEQVLRFLDFLWFYFLKPSSIKKYLHGAAPYATVTGASDGIGKATARELRAQGFNLIIHGRNEKKVKKVVDELKAQGSGDIRYFIADAAKGGYDFTQLLAPFIDLNITLVVHNVGGTYNYGAKVDANSEADLVGIVNWNSVFPLFLTRALLPRLRTTAKRGPVLVEFVGSMAADIAPPTMTVYAATKAFLQVLVRGLDNEERLWGAPSGIEFAYLAVANVSSAGNPAPVSAMAPRAEDFGKALVQKIGCGRRSYAPWMGHAALVLLADTLPEWVTDRIATQVTKEAVERQKKD